mgnify:CR=1 FL=1
MTTIKVEKGDWGLFYKNGEPVHHADIITTKRGAVAVVTGGENPRHSGSTGRVFTNIGSYYPSVFEVEWKRKRRDDKGLNAEQLDSKYNPIGEGEHPFFVRSWWRNDVICEATLMGYWEWVEKSVWEWGDEWE